MNPKITSFIIALIIVGVIATTFTMAAVSLSDKYGADYDNDTLEVFGNTTELHELVEELEDNTNDQTTESGVLDVVGNYIGRAIDTLKLSTASFGVFERMTTTASNKVGLPAYFTVAFISIVLVLIVIGVIASAMIKKDL